MTMPLDALVNIASGVVVVASGLAIFAFSRGRAELRILGATLALWGLFFPAGYLLRPNEFLHLAIWLFIGGSLLAMSIALAFCYPGRASRREAGLLGIGLALTLAWGASAVWRSARDGGTLDDVLHGADAAPLYIAMTLTAEAFLPLALTIRALAAPSAASRLAPLVLLFGLYSAFNAARLVAIFAVSIGAHGLSYLALCLLPAPLWLLVGERGAPARAGRNTALCLAASGLAGAALVVVPGLHTPGSAEFGVPGAIRMVGWVVFALAVLRHGALGFEVRGAAASRGPLAAASLAALFIVAQVAQEFLAAEYGLLMGGIVAGALLFAANPIQRTMERLASHNVASTPTGPASTASVAAYRAAVRAALRDGTLTRREELHLAEVAEHLGIGAREAARLRHEVEDEKEVRS